MADLLSHVLVAYVLLTVASWRVEAVSRRWVAVGMGGAAIPDLSKVGLLVPARVVEGTLGVPFSYGPVSALGGAMVVGGVVALLFGRTHRRRAFAVLVAGSVTSLFVDSLRLTVDGRATRLFYPLTWWRPPSPGLYLTSDPRVLGVAVALATAVFLLDRRQSGSVDTAPVRPDR